MKENTSNRILRRSVFYARNLVAIFAVCSLLALAGCKAKKQLAARKSVDTTAKPINTKALKLEAIRAVQTTFTTFSGKAHAALNISGNSYDVTLNIRIKRDERIWISVSVLGIEGARMMITPDSVMMFERQHSTYVKQPFSYLKQSVGSEFNYKMIESALIGNAIPELLNENADLQSAPEGITITGSLQDFMYKLVTGPDMRVSQTNLDNHNAGQSLQVANSTFIQVDTRVIPSQINISAADKEKTIKADLRYSKTVFDQPVEFPFTIPARYKEAN